MASYGMHEAKTHLSRLVNEAAAGEDVVIKRNGKPVARLVPVEEKPANGLMSLYGIYKGQIHVADDFDELPDDIAEAFGMK